jgi:hypothetical protein
MSSKDKSKLTIMNNNVPLKEGLGRGLLERLLLLLLVGWRGV